MLHKGVLVSQNDEPSKPLALVVVVNGQPSLEYDRNRPLDEKQCAGLDRMDHQMDAGIRLQGDWLHDPDRIQRAQFVASHLIEALQNGNEALSAAACAYLAVRLPGLQQVCATLTGGAVSLELVFDRPWVAEIRVDFDSGKGNGLTS
jgi:hypothetical protein